MKLEYKYIAILLILLLPFSWARASTIAGQGRAITIKGTITDQTGGAMPGVSVVLKGTKNGTMSDADGKYTLTVPDRSATVVFSYTAYKTIERQIGDELIIDVVMTEQSNQLNEVVVVGYGEVRRKDLTGAVSSVNAAQISQQPVTNVLQAIQGRMPGLMITNTSTRPGSTPSVFIRGKRSISGGSDPLYVIDGMPFLGSINDISPADIESVDVLKDASATAIYGARGSNGVVLITTKKGKEGKTQIDFNSRVGVQTALNEVDFMNGAEYAAMIREAYRANNEYKSDVPSWAEDQKIPVFSSDPYTLESLHLAYDANGNYDPSKVRSDSEWWKAVQRKGVVTDNQLSIRGGGAKTNFLISGNYFNDKGIVRSEDYSRYSIRINLEHEISKAIKVGGQTQYLNSLQQRGPTLFGSSWRVMPIGRLYDENGQLMWKVSGTEDQSLNPLQKIAPGAVVKPYKKNDFFGSYFTEIKLPVDGLRYRANFGVESINIQDYEFMNAIARAASVNSAKNATDFRKSYTLENILFYDKVIKDHSFGATLLQSVQKYSRETNSISVQDIPSDELLFNDVGSALVPGAISSNKTQWQLSSFMGRLNYNYKGRYLLTATARYDGSSRLADGHQWVLFPSAAVAWRISDESFMKTVPAISDLKLRIGYGTVASSEVSPYETKGTLDRQYYNFGDKTLIGYAPNKMTNHELTWETTGQWNFGLDFGLFNNRLSGAVNVYQQNTTNLLLDRQLPIVSGFDVVKSNVGSTKNRGIEVSVSSLNVKSGDFKWSTDAMVYLNKEEIVELYNGKIDDPGNKWFIGKPINVFYDYQKTGIWQNTPEDLAEMKKFNDNGSTFKPGTIRLWDNGDYKINEADRVIQGQQRPKTILSLNNTFQYKAFDLSFFFNASYGSMIKTEISYLSQSQRSSGANVDYWTPNNPTNAFPRPIAGVGNLPYQETLQYEKADYIKLRNVTLGYMLPGKITSKLSISSCRFYIQAQNPWMWTTYSGVDPEGVDSDVDGDAAGYTRPTPTIWAAGINLSF
ncbi:MAG: TonB-dependent receptor [Bacteroidota bacterium]